MTSRTGLAYLDVCIRTCVFVCVQAEIAELAKQVMEGRNRYEAVRILRRKVNGEEVRKRQMCV